MKILVVDEDPNAREAIAEALRGQTEAEVLVAASASEGYEALEGTDDLNVLVTAALMAPQDGFHLRSALRARFPELRVAFVSKTDLTRHYQRLAGDVVFYKPVDLEALVRWVAEEQLPEPVEAPPQPEALPAASLPESREGSRIGDYELIRLLRANDRTETYEAMQTSVHRRVAFTMLREELRRSDPEAVHEFLSEVRAKASALHQHVAPVYEAHEEEEALFFTRELLEGRHLAKLLKDQAKLAPRVTVNLIRTVAESMGYFNAQEIAYPELLPKHIYLGADQQARLVNVATADTATADNASESGQIRRFARTMRDLADIDREELKPEHAVVENLLAEMSDEEETRANVTWVGLSVAAREAAKQLELGDVSEYSTIERKAREVTRRKRTLRFVLIGGVLIVAIVLLQGLIALISYLNRPEAREFNEMVRIPSGKFHYQDGSEERELEAFWIDEYEVTIAQYAEFLEAIGAGEARVKKFEHPDQPPSKRGHLPADWKNYYATARKGGFYKGQPVDLNCPVTLVDWWDAFTYAQWRGRRLPSEEEWEKAARGRTGNRYPWGDDYSASRLNSSEDYTEDPNDPEGGTYDGWVFWSPVDAIDEDVSPYEVRGMAGNVSEWTASWSEHPEYPDRQVPVKRGGSFATRTGYELDRRRPANSPEEKSITLGFRTATSTRPEGATGE